jgi:hypothetical protein
MEDQRNQCTTNNEKQPCTCKHTCKKEQFNKIKQQEKHTKDNEESSEQVKNIRHYHDNYYDSLFYGTTFDRIHFDSLFRRYFW